MRDRNHHAERVNRVLDHIGGHLNGELSLKRLAKIGCFSPFHFHRIFQAVTGETLNSHVRRVRLERAALLLRSAPAKRITDVALEVGFGGVAEFSRAFKNHFDRTASSWDRRSPLENSKIGKAPGPHAPYTREELEQWKAAEGIQVKVRQLQPMRFAYVRVYAPYGNLRLMDAYHSLIAWLRERGTELGDIVVIGMSLDDPSITPAAKCRYDLGVGFPIDAANGPGRGECSRRGFSLREFEPLLVAGIHCVGELSQVDRAWQYLFKVWLPDSRYEPADRPAMEMFVRLPEEIGWTTFDLQAYLPVARF